MGCGTSVDVKEFKYQREVHLGFRKSTSRVSDAPSPTCSPWTHIINYATTKDGGPLPGECWPSDGLQVVSVTTLEGHTELETVHRQKNRIFQQKQNRAGHNIEKTGIIRKTRSDETGSADVPPQQTDTPPASQSYPVIPGTIEQSRPKRDKPTLEYNRDIFTHLKCKDESSSDDKAIRHTVSMEGTVRGYNVTLDPPIRSQVLPPDDNQIYRLRGLFTAEGTPIRGSIGLNYSPISIGDSTASEEMNDSEEIAEEHFHQLVKADSLTTKEANDTNHPTLDCQAGQVELRTKQKLSDGSQSLGDIIQEGVDLADRDRDDNSMSVVAEGFETPSVLSLLNHVDHRASDKSDADDEMSELTSLRSVSSHSSLGDMDNWIEEGYYPMAECDPSGIEIPPRDDHSPSSLPHVISKLLKSKTLPKAKTTSSNPALPQPNNFVNLLKLPESSHKLGLGDHTFRSSTFYQPTTTSSPTLQPLLCINMSDNSNNCGTARPAASAVVCRGGGSSDGAISMVSGDCEEMTSCSNIHLHENFFNDFGDNFDDEDFRRL